MIGKQVRHRAFGLGSITGFEDGRITVNFSGAEKRFQFPEAFAHFLTTEDTELQKMVEHAILEKAEIQKKEEEARRKEQAERRAAANSMIEAAANNPFPTLRRAGYAKPSTHGENVSVAFKCNYCDGGSSSSCLGFRGKCSDQMIKYHIGVAKHVWCSTGSVCKRYFDGCITRAELDAYREPNSEYAACYESSFFETWQMEAGVYQSGERAGQPMRMERISSGSLAVMTTREADAPETDRFIFAVFLIKSAFSGDEEDAGIVRADPQWRIELSPAEAHRMHFWNYYFNTNKPEKIVFGSGLHRYLTETQAAQILRDIATILDDEFARAFYEHYCSANGLDPNSLPPAAGALVMRGNNPNMH